jgi:hypothetical protein
VTVICGPSERDELDPQAVTNPTRCRTANARFEVRMRAEDGK